MIDQLVNLIQPLADPARSDVDWRALETALGLQLPKDYRQLYDTYGDGAFNGYLWFLSPAPDEDTGLLAQTEEMRWMLSELKEDDPDMIRFDVRAGSKELLGCATTLDGDMIFWLTTASDDPNSWPIRICDPGGWDWEEYAGGLSQYLHAIHSGEIESGILADDIADQPHHFARHGEPLELPPTQPTTE